MKKIIHVSHHYWPQNGGQEKIIDMMINARRESINYVIQPLKLAFFNPKNYKTRRNNNVKIIPIITLGFLIYTILKILRLDDRFSNICEQISWVSFNFSLKLFFPIIRLFVGENSLTIVHYHFHSKSVKTKNKIIFSHGIEWNEPPVTFLDKKRLSSIKNITCTKLIANDNNYLKKYFEFNPNSKKSIHFLPNPVDTSVFFKKINYRERLVFKRIIMVRNIREDRGILEGINAFKLLPKDWEMFIVGSYNIKEKYFLECIKESNDEKISFLGSKSTREIIDIMNLCTISLVPSQSKEGTSLSALESMAIGLPCVSTNVGGLKDLPTFKSENITYQSIYEAILRVLENYDQISSEQFDCTSNNYSFQNWALKFNQILNEE